MSNDNSSVDSVRVAYPLFQAEGGGSTPTSTLHCRDLIFEPCLKQFAARLVEEWHSRLPVCQSGPWMYAFHAAHGDLTYAVALWNNPSARTLPNEWLELRRMACAPDAPKNTPSRFLAWMARYFQKHRPDIERLISYQDTAVHAGTIYKAAGWHVDHEGVARARDRSKNRVGTRRAYRSNINGDSADASQKIRWARVLSDTQGR